ncbi:hypothetical protein RFI_01308, partial [Reticulomyxa filosa]
IKLGWIQEFDKLVVKYAATVFILDTFRSSSKLLKTFRGHTNWVNSIDCTTFNDCQFLCSGSDDQTVRVWDIENSKQIQSFNEHSGHVYCVKFSSYYNHYNRRNVICSSSTDKTIRFWDIQKNQQFQIYKGHTDAICHIEFSLFNSGRYLCSGSHDKTICLWDVETSKTLHVFNGHKYDVLCVAISPLQSNSNKNNNIGGNGYTICSGSCDTTICIWDIETTKQLTVFNGHKSNVWSVKYGPSELGNIGSLNAILSGSHDKSVRLWDIRSGQQIQMFNGHTNTVYAVEYSPFIVNNIEISDNSNVICSGSFDNTIRFWDIRSNKNELYVIKGNIREDFGVRCFKFIQVKKKIKESDITNRDCDSMVLFAFGDKYMQLLFQRYLFIIEQLFLIFLH